jgi:hypothetical protein
VLEYYRGKLGPICSYRMDELGSQEICNIYAGYGSGMENVAVWPYALRVESQRKATWDG